MGGGQPKVDRYLMVAFAKRRKLQAAVVSVERVCHVGVRDAGEIRLFFVDIKADLKTIDAPGIAHIPGAGDSR